MSEGGGYRQAYMITMVGVKFGFSLLSWRSPTGPDLFFVCLSFRRIFIALHRHQDVRMISAEAPVLFAKACEVFILELTLRAWCYSEQNKRRTLQKEDVQMAIKKTDIFDFLEQIIN